MSITRTPLVDDDGSGETGTLFENAWQEQLYDAIDDALQAVGDGEASITLTGNQDDLDFSNAGVLRCNNASLLTIRGLAAGADGQRLTIISVGAGQVDLANQNANSAAANRLINGVTGSISLAAGVGRVSLQYDGTTDRWRVVMHEQGAFITRTFAAGNFTANASMTWTVAAGDVITDAYYLKGRQLTYVAFLVTTTVGGTPDTTLKIAIPGGFTAAKRARNNSAWLSDNGTARSGFFDIGAVAATTIDVWRTDAANFTAATDATTVAGELIFEVQ